MITAQVRLNNTINPKSLKYVSRIPQGKNPRGALQKSQVINRTAFDNIFP